MLTRLILNVLTMSSIQIAGQLSSLSDLRSYAETYLVSIIKNVDPGVNTEDRFVQAVLSDENEVVMIIWATKIDQKWFNSSLASGGETDSVRTWG